MNIKDYSFQELKEHFTSQEIVEYFESKSDKESFKQKYDWPFWARNEQLYPIDKYWFVWLIQAGRGWGKTRTGAETTRQFVEQNRKHQVRIALVAKDAADARDVMIEGESGLLTISNPAFKPTYEPSKRRLTWPNGSMATTYSSEDPESLRGPQHNFAWGDEPAKWKYWDTWTQLKFGLRLGKDPRIVLTTTPKPFREYKELAKKDTTYVTRGSTYDNRDNLSTEYFQEVIDLYRDTRIGRQEVFGDVLEDLEGALWNRDIIEKYRIKTDDVPNMKRIVVAIDPSVTSGEDSDEAGIVVMGKGTDDRGYLLEDGTIKASPLGWGKKGVNLYHDYSADKIIAEVNNGGDLVETVIRGIDQNISYKAVRATRGKITRAEPIHSLYEQGKISHVGMYGDLEDEMCTYDGSKTMDSPNRLDAMVWAATELFPTRGNVYVG